MSYLRPRPGAAPISPEAIELLARLAGLTILSDDIEAVATALRSQLASIESLDELDLTDLNPMHEFNPCWQE